MTARAGRASIRRRMLALTVLALLLAGIGLVALIRGYARGASDSAFDRLLAASAFTIAGAVQIEDGAVTVELPTASLAMLDFSDDDRVFYEVAAPDGAFVTGYRDLGAGLPTAASATPGFIDGTYHGEAVRIATVGRLVFVEGKAGWATIRVAETRGAREALASEILGQAALPLAALGLVAIALVWFGIRYAFAPLVVMERELRRRAPEDLSPVQVPVPVEVQQLTGALNDFIARLRSVMERVSGLVADAAHQVRTPLASLRAQAEVAVEEEDPARLRDRVVRIHQNAVQASHLVNQLLMDATVRHRLEAREATVVALDAIVEDVRQRLDFEEAGRLSVTLAPEAARAGISGDRVALREMLWNLVHNALTHAPAGDVEIEAAVERGRAVIRVSDRGPGIPAVEKDLVLERFARGEGSRDRPGSGLGLSIVRTVAEAHGGTLALLDRPGGGLRVEVTLPVVEAARRRPNGTAAALLLAAALLVATIGPVRAAPGTTVYPAPAGGERTLTILGATDTPLFARFIADFQALRPEIRVVYQETDTLPMYQAASSGRLSPVPDLMISSAPDLQVKLANDGFAQAYASPWLDRLPHWAQWRAEAIGFTFEPAVIAYNPDLLAEAEVPHSHAELIALLEAQPERFRGRVATYDIAVSGIGHLLASQDALISSNFWRLAAAFGRVDAKLSGSSPEMLDRIVSGELILGYNLLGSYAFARQAAGLKLGVVVPEDYALVMTRVALIPRGAPDAELARAFVDYLLSPRGQALAAGVTGLGAIMPDISGPWSAGSIAGKTEGALQPIPLGPSLLVALDERRRERFLQTWRRLVSDGTEPMTGR
ncbi:extracellular solute-binding protein [Mycobacterium sp. KBS0706]|uniref:sensor histidine kinase n=1 Tax=Mycobacterium sp. KBS0706 TaxID=2578109 RepID=UPI001C8F4FA2|nr:extracellular solute-binding protein [Mycobacterium sp. KBS0706]